MGHPFTSGAIHGFHIHAIIHTIREFKKPNFLRIDVRKEIKTLSKALVMSNLMVIPFYPLDLLECTASWTRIMLSKICCC